MRVATQNGGCEIGNTRYMTEGCGRVGGRPFVDFGIYERREGDDAFAATDSVRLHLGGHWVPDDMDTDDLVRCAQRQQAARDRPADDGSI